MENKLTPKLKERLEEMMCEVGYNPSEIRASTYNAIMGLLSAAYHLDRSEWIKHEAGEPIGKNDSIDRIVLLFDTGETAFYKDEDWHRAIVTHWVELPPIDTPLIEEP